MRWAELFSLFKVVVILSGAKNPLCTALRAAAEDGMQVARPGASE
jgi:hypothetical protein